MERLLNRYRNITVLLLVILAQLVLIAVQVRNDQDVSIIRVWAVTAVTPFARLLETGRGGTTGFLHNYFLLHDTHAENLRLQADVDRLKMENQFLKTELSTAERAKALVAFQARTPSKTIAARIIASGAGANSKVVFVDRGSGAGVEKGMPVVTPDGIVGKVIAAYPTASEVELITDPDFAAGVVSQKGQVTGTLKGQGYANCKVDYVPSEEKVDPGEWFYTSGDDRVFPKGFPVGVARVVRNGSPYKEIFVEPSGLQHGLEAVLIMLEGVHQAIPEAPPANAPVYLGTPPPQAAGTTAGQPPAPMGTDADRLRQRYQQIGEAQGHKFGEGTPGSKAPDFNLKVPAPGAQAPTVGTPQPQGSDAATRRHGDTASKPPGAQGAPVATPQPQGSDAATRRHGDTASKPPGAQGAPVGTPQPQGSDAATGRHGDTASKPPGAQGAPVGTPQPQGNDAATGRHGDTASKPPGVHGAATGRHGDTASKPPGVHGAPVATPQPQGNDAATGRHGDTASKPPGVHGASAATPQPQGSDAATGRHGDAASTPPGVQGAPAAAPQPPGARGRAGEPASGPRTVPQKKAAPTAKPADKVVPSPARPLAPSATSQRGVPPSQAPPQP